MKKVLYILDQIEEKFLVSAFAITVLLILTQVFMRKVINYSLSWSEELARYLFIWQCWVGISLAERYSKHIRITILPDKLKDKSRAGLELFVLIILLVTSLTLAVYGMEMVVNLVASGSSSAALKIPIFFVYLALPVGCLLFALRIILKFVTFVTGKEF
jgi:C4-dicarboxylate transporter DctQ subunit